MLRVETFSMLPDFSTDDDDDEDDVDDALLSTSQLLFMLDRCVMVLTANDSSPVSNVFVLLKGFLSEWEAQFSSVLLELVIDARRIG